MSKQTCNPDFKFNKILSSDFNKSPKIIALLNNWILELMLLNSEDIFSRFEIYIIKNEYNKIIALLIYNFI